MNLSPIPFLDSELRVARSGRTPIVVCRDISRALFNGASLQPHTRSIPLGYRCSVPRHELGIEHPAPLVQFLTDEGFRHLMQGMNHPREAEIMDWIREHLTPEPDPRAEIRQLGLYRYNELRNRRELRRAIANATTLDDLKEVLLTIYPEIQEP